MTQRVTDEAHQAYETATIQRLLSQLNETWIRGDPRKVAAFFAEDAVIVHPAFRGRTVGRDACVQTYVGFRAGAQNVELHEGEVEVDVLGPTAIASYTYTISYRFDGQAVMNSGRDLYVLRRNVLQWQIVWRTLLLDASAA